MMSDTDIAIARLEELRELGVRLAMDDFGTGYSSLSYLSRFPVDVLKMDRSFLHAGATPETSGLASAVIAIGETLQLDVVAEGIELNEQWLTLRDLGCARGQGFLFARPMPAAETIEALRSWAAREMADVGSEPEALSGWSCPPAMLHSHEALDREGGFSPRPLGSTAASPRLPPALDRHVRVAARRRRLPGRDGVAGLHALGHAHRAGVRGHRDERADDRCCCWSAASSATASTGGGSCSRPTWHGAPSSRCWRCCR